MTEKSSVNTLVSDNLAYIHQEMVNACNKAGRSIDEVRLLAVTKTVDAERINAAIAAGVKQIGENRVQEFLQKKAFQIFPVFLFRLMFQHKRFLLYP